MNYDVAIIGLGPSGIEFAKEALKNGLKVIAFEKSSAGGTCLNLGCVPTKTLLGCAEVFSKIKNCTKYGIELDSSSVKFSYPQMCKKRVDVVSKIRSALVKDLTSKGLEIVNTSASINYDGGIASVIADNKEFHANYIIVATGSKPNCIKGFDFNSNDFLSSDDLLSCDELPNSILIIGSGAIGVEWATILRTLGVEVFVIEMAKSLAPSCDIDVSSRIERIFKMNKIKFFKDTTLLEFKNGIAKLSNGLEINCEKVFCAAGRMPVLPKTEGVELILKDNCTTNIKNLFVAGDASGAKMLAHAASYQARALYNHIYKGAEFHISDIPSVIYTNPEIASIGLREQDLEDKSQYTIVKLPISYLAKSWCDGEIDGFIKLIIKDNRIKGAHIVSKEASALIMQIAVMMKANMDLDTINDIVFAHPTYSEGIAEAIKNAQIKTA